MPGKGTYVPLYILGSSVFGAQLAAALGLPYAFASHFAPDQLQPAVQTYRSEFKPSEQLSEPYVIAALNVVAANDDAPARMYEDVLRARVVSLASRFGVVDRKATDAEIEMLIDSPAGNQAKHMLTYTAVGGPERVGADLEQFADRDMADELIVTNAARGLDAQKKTLDVLASLR